MDVKRVDGLFADLDDQPKFHAHVKAHFESTPPDLAKLVRCTNTIDPARIDYAFGEYQQNLIKFAVLLHSKNPDHYKRAGAVLHALYTSNIVTGVEFNTEDLQHIEAGFSRHSYTDEQYTLRFVEFFRVYNNELLSFDFAYRCCAAYEKNPRIPTFDYIHNLCFFLKKNPTLNLDTAFIIFKSLML